MSLDYKKIYNRKYRRRWRKQLDTLKDDFDTKLLHKGEKKMKQFKIGGEENMSVAPKKSEAETILPYGNIDAETMSMFKANDVDPNKTPENQPNENAAKIARARNQEIYGKKVNNVTKLKQAEKALLNSNSANDSTSVQNGKEEERKSTFLTKMEAESHKYAYPRHLGVQSRTHTQEEEKLAKLKKQFDSNLQFGRVQDWKQKHEMLKRQIADQQNIIAESKAKMLDIEGKYNSTMNFHKPDFERIKNPKTFGDHFYNFSSDLAKKVNKYNPYAIPVVDSKEAGDLYLELRNKGMSVKEAAKKTTEYKTKESWKDFGIFTATSLATPPTKYFGTGNMVGTKLSEPIENGVDKIKEFIDD